MATDMKRVPEIRFDEFTEAWEQHKLWDVTDEFKSGSFIAAANIEDEGEYPVYGGNGLRGYANSYNHDGEFALIGRQGALCGNMNYSTGKAYITEHAVAVKANNSSDTKFLYYLLDTMRLGQYSDQSAQPGLAVGKLTQMESVFPTQPEQEIIAEYFTNLDNLIALHQRKCDSLKNLKKACLIKMFPKNGERVPEIRFEGFTEAWEQRKLGNLCDEIIAGGTPSTARDEYWEPKSIPWLSSGEVHKKYIFSTDNSISKEGYNNSSAKWVKKDSVLIALAGQGKTRGTVAINRIPLTTNQSIAAMVPSKEIDCGFLFQSLEGRYEEIRLLSSAYGSRGGLNKQMVADIDIIFPQMEEQRLISNYLFNLDNLITLHQSKCDKLKNIKKAMLQKMFI